MNYVYEYLVDFWDEVEEKQSKERGIIIGKTYTEAVENLINYYGADNVYGIENLAEYEIGDGNVLSFKELMQGIPSIKEYIKTYFDKK